MDNHGNSTKAFAVCIYSVNTSPVTKGSLLSARQASQLAVVVKEVLVSGKSVVGESYLGSQVLTVQIQYFVF